MLVEDISRSHRQHSLKFSLWVAEKQEEPQTCCCWNFSPSPKFRYEYTFLNLRLESFETGGR